MKVITATTECYHWDAHSNCAWPVNDPGFSITCGSPDQAQQFVAYVNFLIDLADECVVDPLPLNRRKRRRRDDD